MSTTYVEPVTAEAPVNSLRRRSKWGKIFTGFKFNDSGCNVTEVEITDDSKSPSEDGDDADFQKPLKRYSVNETAPIKLQKRNSSFSFIEKLRKPSNASSVGPKERPQKARAASTISNRRSSWFQSSNPDYDGEPVDRTDDTRKTSTISDNSNPTSLSPGQSRRPSYVPRNAANSFLNTTTTREERRSLGGSVSMLSDARRASTASASALASASTSLTTDTLPSSYDVTPGSVSPSESRRSSYNPRASSSSVGRSKEESYFEQEADGQNGEAQQTESTKQTKPVTRRASRDILERHRMLCLAGIADIDESWEEHEHPPTKGTPITPSLTVEQPTPPMKSSKRGSPAPLSPTRKGDTSWIKQHDSPISPKSLNFNTAAKDVAAEEHVETVSMSTPETPLESLGFRGAVAN